MYITNAVALVLTRSAEGATQQVDEPSAEEEEEDNSDWQAVASDASILDKQLCTFVETQRDFKQQHWSVSVLYN